MNEIVKIEFLDGSQMLQTITAGALTENPMGDGQAKVVKIILNDADDVAVEYDNGYVVGFVNTPIKLVFAPHPTDTKESPAARTEHDGDEDNFAGGQSGPGGQAPAGSAADSQ